MSIPQELTLSEIAKLPRLPGDGAQAISTPNSRTHSLTLMNKDLTQNTLNSLQTQSNGEFLYPCYYPVYLEHSFKFKRIIILWFIC